MKKFKRVRILTATSAFQVEWSNWGSYGKTAHFSFKWAKPTLLHSFYTVLPIFYFTMLPKAPFSAAKVWLWIIKKWGWIVIYSYNPTKVPIKLEENRCSLNAYTFYKNNLKQIRRAPARRRLRPLVLFLLTVPRRFLCCSSSLFMHTWFNMWRLFCYYLFLISPSFGTLGGLCFVTVAFLAYVCLLIFSILDLSKLFLCAMFCFQYITKIGLKTAILMFQI